MKNTTNTFSVFSDSKIYIIGCPWAVSGGPEAIHQLVYYLKQLKYPVFLVYPDANLPEDYQIREPYQKYINSYLRLKDIEDTEHNIIVFPEAHGLEFFGKFKRAQKGVWFLGLHYYRAFYSKDFDTVTKIKRGLRIAKHFTFSLFGLDFFIKNDNTVKMAASHHAYNYLKSHNSNPQLMIEPISLEFINYFKETNYSLDLSNERSNNILYNPAKGDNEMIANQLKSYLPDCKFIPLKDYTHEEMADLMRNSKVYIDFGPFSGAERIPKEAAIYGMCIITGRNGASNYYGDVAIPDKYKFADYAQQLTDIANTITDLLNNYKQRISDFAEYRQMVYDLESNFKSQLKTIFKKVNI